MNVSQGKAGKEKSQIKKPIMVAGGEQERPKAESRKESGTEEQMGERIDF